MRKALIGFVMGVAVASSGVALAQSERLINLRAGDQASFQGVLCTTSGAAHAVACALADEYWYTVLLSRRQVIVVDKAGHQVFFKRR